MKRKGCKTLSLVLVLLTLTIALSACSGDKAGDSASSSSITIGIPQDIEDSLDPHKAVAAGTEEVFFNLYEGLVKPDSNGNLQPAVASSYTILNDGKIYQFTLRENVKFHDGSVVTAEDVKYSLERCAGTGNEEPLVAAYSNLEEVKIVDNQTIQVLLVTPDTEFLPYLTEAVLPLSNTDPAAHAIGTGPYRFVSHSPQESFVMEKFEDYWGEPAQIETVTLKVYANADSVAMDMRGGSLDMVARVSTAAAAELGDEFEVLEGTMNLVQAVYLNNAAEPFHDVRVRQALCYAADKQQILDFVSDGKGTPIGSSMYPAFGKYYLEELNDLYQTDREKAKELLAEAGYPDGFSFVLTVPSNYIQHVDTAQVLVEQYKQIGVDMQIELIEWDTWLSRVYRDRDYQATVVGVDASSLTARALLERFTSDAGNNFTNYDNPAYDEAFAGALAATDDAEKTKLYQTCERILAEDAANVYIQDLPELVAIHKRYAGYEFYPLYVQDYAKLYLTGGE